MKFKNVLLAVNNMEKSVNFYKQVLGLHVTMDLGVNVTLTGGVCLQEKNSWAGFLEDKSNRIAFGGNDAELYFEEDAFDGFLEKLKDMEDIQYVHSVKEHSWGQRVVRFYDPDQHIIEVGENMRLVCRRFLDSGMTEEEAAARMDVPVQYVRACRR